MKTKQMFLSAHRDYGQVWWTLTSPQTGCLPGRMPVGLIDLPVDVNKVISDLDAFDETGKEAKRAALLAQLAELDEQEAAA